MGVYRFIGTECAIGDQRKLQRFGQSIDLPDDVATELIMGGGPDQGFAGASALLPDEDFKTIFEDMDPKELDRFAIPANQFGDAAAGFRELKQKALERLHEIRMSVTEKEPANG